jgi:hypothetical protein
MKSPLAGMRSPLAGMNGPGTGMKSPLAGMNGPWPAFALRERGGGVMSAVREHRAAGPAALKIQKQVYDKITRTTGAWEEHAEAIKFAEMTLARISHQGVSSG